MAYNLLNLCQENLDRGVVECFNAESTLLKVIPVQNVTGHAVAYNQVKNGFTIAKRELGQEIVTEQEMETTKVVEPLEISANRVKVDRGLVLMSGDDVARQIHLDILTKVKNVAGVKVDASGSMPTADEVAEGMDGMKSIDNAMMFCNAKTNRALQKEAISQGFTYGQIEAFGKKMYQFNNVPVEVTQDLEDGEVIIANFDVAEGVSLATNGGVRALDWGLNGVFYRTDIEFIGLPVVKNTKAVAYIKNGLSRKK